jgi:hypothetical protein
MITQPTEGSAGALLVGSLIQLINPVLPPLCVWPNGQNLLRAKYPLLLSASRITLMGNTTTGGANVTNITGNAEVLTQVASASANGVAWAIESPAITPGAVITMASFSGTTLVLSSGSFTAAGNNVPIYLYPYNNGDGLTSFGTIDVRGRALFARDNMGGVAATRITQSGIIIGVVLGSSGGDQNYQQHAHSISDPTHFHSMSSGYEGAGAQAEYVSLTDNNANFDTQMSTNYDYTGISGTDQIGSGQSNNIPPATICNCAIFAGE